MVSLFVVSSLAFGAIILRSFDLRNALQLMNNAVRLACFLIVTLGKEVFKFIDKLCICNYFKNLLEFHPGPCIYPCFIHGQGIAWTVYIIRSCTCKRGPT